MLPHPGREGPIVASQCGHHELMLAPSSNDAGELTRLVWVTPVSGSCGSQTSQPRLLRCLPFFPPPSFCLPCLHPPFLSLPFLFLPFLFLFFLFFLHLSCVVAAMRLTWPPSS